MSGGRAQSVEQLGAWRGYREAFHDFSERVRQLQSLATDPHPNQDAIEAALVEVEKARQAYDRCRDALAQYLMPSSKPRRVPRADSPEAHREHVRDIAELLWESAGRPDGTAENDWRRAEEILRRAGTLTAA